MIKVKDGYAKLIDTTASGSASRVLLSNGGDHILGNANGNIPLNNGTVSTNLNADMLDGLHIHTGRNNEVNKVVRTDASGYILAGWINTTSGDMGTTAATRIYCSNDGYIRYKTPANFFNILANDGNQISITVGSQNRKLTINYATNADMLDGLHWNSFARWYGDASTDSTAKDVTATSTADFFAKIHATSGLFNSRFGAMRGSWWYVGNTLLNTGVGTLEMAGTAVLNLGSYADTNDTYKSLLFLTAYGDLYSYASEESGVATWSRYSKEGHSHRVTKLHRSDGSDDYYLRHYWTGSYWHLQGYYGSSYHAGVQVAYADWASNAGNADTVDGQHFNWNNNKNDHTYLWAASSSGLAYLVHRASMSVNYATYARYVYCTSGSYLNFQWSGQGGLPTWLFGSNDGANVYVWNPSNFSVNSAAVLRGNASNPNNSHPGHGAKVFYSWDTGQANNASSGYSNGITIGSHPNDTAYGFQIVQNMWDDRTYTRRYNGGWLSWKTLAWTSDIPSVGNGTVTIKQAGTTKGSFTMNQSGNTTIELTDNNTTYSFAAKGSSTQGIYLAGTNTFATMTYSLKATVNSGTSNKLAYYSGANAISAYTSTCGDYYKPIYLSGGVPIECYSRSIGSVTWGTNCSGYIQVKLFGPIVILQGYFTKINVNQTSSTNYVFKLPTGTPSPATTVGITLSLDDGYENDRNTIIMISGQYGYCNTGYNSFNPNGWTYYFSACYMA